MREKDHRDWLICTHTHTHARARLGGERRLAAEPASLLEDVDQLLHEDDSGHTLGVCALVRRDRFSILGFRFSSHFSLLGEKWLLGLTCDSFVSEFKYFFKLLLGGYFLKFI